MAKKEMFLCDDCIYFSDKCEHKSNVFIKLQRRIEKKSYISLKKKKVCDFYIQSESRIDSTT